VVYGEHKLLNENQLLDRRACGWREYVWTLKLNALCGGMTNNLHTLMILFITYTKMK
jgi:hypothetical protein